MHNLPTVFYDRQGAAITREAFLASDDRLVNLIARDKVGEGHVIITTFVGTEVQAETKGAPGKVDDGLFAVLTDAPRIYETYVLTFGDASRVALHWCYCTEGAAQTGHQIVVAWLSSPANESRMMLGRGMEGLKFPGAGK